MSVFDYFSKSKAKIETDSKKYEIDSGSILRTSSSISKDALYARYEQNGILQNIVNAPADDATREGFKINVNDDFDADDAEKINNLLQQRLSELSYKNKLRNVIKYSRIYAEGSGLYYGVVAGRNETLESVLDLSIPIPEQINKVDFITVLDNPRFFSLTFKNVSDPTLNNFGVPTFNISGKEIHGNRISWLINEFDNDAQTGISIINKVLPAIDAQEAGINGSTNILERVGALLLKSEQASLKRNTATTIMNLTTLIKQNIKSNGAMALLRDDVMEFLKYQFSGIKEVYEYVLDNLSGLSGIPRNILLGNQRGGIITGDGNEGELLNYFGHVQSFQKNTLEPLIRFLIDLLLKEEANIELLKITGGNPINYEIEFNSLWSLSQKEQVEIEKLRAETDEINTRIGKQTAEEARTLDPKLSQLDPLTLQFEGEND